MNKEQLRKELEDAMDWSLGYNFGDTQVWIRDRNTYITTRMAAIDDGDEKVEDHTVSNAIGAFDESLRVAKAAFHEPDPAIYYKEDELDDGQEGRELFASIISFWIGHQLDDVDVHYKQWLEIRKKITMKDRVDWSNKDPYGELY